jgi:putative flavoprotein involved in K+ transport
VILDAENRVGDAWRKRWDALRVFTAVKYDSLPGMPFPGPRHAFPTKDEVADYLASYAERFDLHVRTGTVVDGIRPVDDAQGGYLVTAGDHTFLAGNVVVATGAYRHPRIPGFAADLDPSIRQLHSSAYQHRDQLQPGAVLVVGASHSGVEIAMDVSKDHRTWLSGRDTGQVPIDMEGRIGRLVDPVIWFVVNHVLTVRTPMGRKALARMRTHGAPLERVRRSHVQAAGIQRLLARTVGVRDGLPLLDDGQVVDVANVVWCTGFRPEFGWIHLPLDLDGGLPRQVRGVVPGIPGLYFVGLPYMYSFASPLIGGVGRDAIHIARHIATRLGETRRALGPERAALGV